MTKWMQWIKCAVCVSLMTAIVISGQAEEIMLPSENIQEEQETKPVFENPDGMIVDLVYYYIDAEGNEKTAGRADRVIIPAGTTSVTVDLQKKMLPHGYGLWEPEDLILEEDSEELRIQVAILSSEGTEPDEPDKNPPDVTEKPSEPTEPGERPTEPVPPVEKPTEPENHSDEQEEKPSAKPQKPPKPAENKKPDPTNPKTGDPFYAPVWIFSGLTSAGILFLIWKRKQF